MSESEDLRWIYEAQERLSKSIEEFERSKHKSKPVKVESVIGNFCQVAATLLSICVGLFVTPIMILGFLGLFAFLIA